MKFKDLLLSIVSFTRPGIQTEIDRFFKSLSESVEFETITKSAFSQSRKKLKFEAFAELSKLQLSFFNSNAPKPTNWKEKRIVAIDGSLLNLPNSEELMKEFGFVHNQYEKLITARCSFAFDVCNELVLDAKIDKFENGEKDLAVSHLDSLNPETDILVFDRGYASHWLIGLLMKKGFQFCFRLSTNWKDAVSLTNSNKNDIDWVLKRNSKAALGKIKDYNIPKELNRLRMLKIALSSGEKEILITNILNRKEYDLNAMKELYNLRWSVEESYKIFKKTLHIEHFTGKSALSVKQDFYAKVFMMNLSSMIRTQLLNEKKRKHILKPNKTQVIAKVKDFLIDIFYQYDIVRILEQLKVMLEKCYEIVRPNRSFKRVDGTTRRRYRQLIYKGV